MELNDLLEDGHFIESYNNSSRRKGRLMKPRIGPGGCFFELKEL